MYEDITTINDKVNYHLIQMEECADTCLSHLTQVANQAKTKIDQAIQKTVHTAISDIKHTTKQTKEEIVSTTTKEQLQQNAATEILLYMEETNNDYIQQL